MSEQKNRSRGFCYTIPNYTDDDIARCMALFEDDTRVSYTIIGFEVCPRTNTPHIQGYIYYPNKLKYTTMKDLLYPYHVEKQKAKFNVNSYCYCMEERDYYEMGERPRQGHRTDLEVIKHDILNGKSQKDIANQYFSQWCQYRRPFEKFRKLNTVNRQSQLVIYDTKPHMIQQIYTLYDKTRDFIIKSRYEYNLDIIQHMYFSKKYRYIFCPGGAWLEELNDYMILLEQLI